MHIQPFSMDLKQHNSLGFYLGRTARAVKAVFNLRLAELGFDISFDQWHILMYLWNEQPIAQNMICSMSSKDKTTVTRIIKGLEKKGYIIRKQDDEDRRKYHIYLTEKGDRSKNELIPLANEIIEVTEKNLNEQEINTLKELLTKIYENLKEYKPNIYKYGASKDE
mgnify:CR=1 FL=1